MYFKLLIIVIIVIVIILYRPSNIESFTEINSSLRNQIDLEDKVHNITMRALKDNKLRKEIEEMIEIYKKIKKDKELFEYLKFKNVINGEGMPIFIRESEEELLKNKVRIIELTTKKFE